MKIHPENPQKRQLQLVVDCVLQGGVIAYPTDSGYALGCELDDKDAMLKIRQLRQLDNHHHFTLMCADLSELGTYAQVNNATFRLLKTHTPGPYTFILPATRIVPRRLQHPKRKTIGLRIPDHPITQGLLAMLGQPMMSVTLTLPEHASPYQLDAEEIAAHVGGQVDMIIDSGVCSISPTTVVDLTGLAPQVIREGQGDATPFLP